MAEEKKNGKEAKDKQEAQQPQNPQPEAKEPQSETAELKDRLLRLAAEFDNYKKRVAKDLDAAKSVGKVEMVKKLLPTLDEFELALQAMKDAEHARGVEMVYSNFLDALKSQGLEEIPAKGKADPFKHEVILARESDKKEGEIIEVVRKGYTLNGILIRPSSVIVSNGTPVQANK